VGWSEIPSNAFFRWVEFPKLAWTGRFAVHGEGNENTKDAKETSI
jgi:hypothetical protein